MKPAHLQILCDDSTSDLKFFANCADEWVMSDNSVKKTRKRFMNGLYHVSAHTQWCIAQVIKKLFKCQDWAKHNKEVV
jgi:hypothetical protein